MKKTVRVGLFFGIFVLLLAVFSGIFYRLATVADEGLQSRNAAFIGIKEEQENTIDVLVLGDSETYTSISPMQLYQDTGITTYVCGQSQQRVHEAYSILKTALKTQKPKLVILETNTLFRYKGQNTEMEKYLGEQICNLLPVFRYHYMWKMPFDGDSASNTQYKGFRLRDKVAAYKGGDYMKETEEVAEIPEWNKSCVEDIISLCEENDIRLMFISVPSPKNYNYKEHNALEQYAKELNVPYLDLNLKNEELGMDWNQDTMDKGDHLNIHGAVKVTDYMSKFLVENYEWEDHRQDEKYSEWTLLAEEYEKRLQKIVVKQ